MKRYVSFNHWVLRLFVVIAVLSAGCHDNTQEPRREEKPPITVYDSGIEAVALQRDPERKEVRAVIGSGDRQRRVTIRQVTTTPLGSAMHAQITDEHGDLRYSIELAVNVEKKRMWFRERTSADVLTASIARHDDRVIEEYDINGDVHVIQYTVSDERAFEQMAASPATDPPPEFRGASAKLREFETFFAPHKDNTLHNNRDGELLWSLLTEREFADFVTGTGTIRGPQRVKDPMKRTCWAAFTCANVMCRFGGLSNPACVACGGIASACIITEIACWFANCGCCF